MNTNNRAAVLTKTHRVLKKHYKPVAPPSNRSLLEHLLYGCVLENARHEQADEAFAKLQQSYFDWNEVRVTTIGELALAMPVLPDAPVAAKRLKRVLHHVFETHYTFDIDFYKKQNLGKAAKEIEKLNGVTPFVLAYFIQNGLGGHSIPLSSSSLQILYIAGAIGQKDMAKKKAPGLERAIAKTKGAEFGSLIHQMAVELAASPFSNRLRGILLEIAADAKERLPKRGKKETPEKPKKARTAKQEASSKAVDKKSAAQTVDKKTAAKKAASPKSPPAKSTKKAAAKKPAAKKAAAKKPAAKKVTAKKTAKKTTKKSSKKSPTKSLAKKKPR